MVAILCQKQKQMLSRHWLLTPPLKGMIIQDSSTSYSYILNLKMCLLVLQNPIRQHTNTSHVTQYVMFYVFCVKTDKDLYTKNNYETFGQLELSGKARRLERQLPLV